MEIWIAATVIASVVVGLALRRFLAPASSEVDLGQVSQRGSAKPGNKRTLAPHPLLILAVSPSLPSLNRSGAPT